MSILAAARADLANALAGLTTADGIPVPVHNHPPETIAPPCVVLSAADPWVKPSDAFDAAYLVALNVHLIAGTSTNEPALALLEDLLDKALTAIPDQWVWGDVVAPHMATVGTSVYLATTIPLNALL